MNFEDLKDRIIESLRNLWDKVQESSIYITLRERYENLSPKGQKLTILGTLLVLLFLVFLTPFESLLRSNGFVDEFETKRELVGRMQEAHQEIKQGPNIPAPPPSEALESQIRQRINQARLMPQQVVSIAPQPVAGNLIPRGLADTGFMVRLSKLNLTQILDIGKSLAGIHPSVKLKDMSVNTGNNEEGYFDVGFELIPLAVPKDEIVAPSDEKNEGDNRGRNRRPPRPRGDR